jgi:8-amino-7-oxononanoate synthase
MRTVLVTGSDTGVGKTHVVAALARQLAADGTRGQIVKLVETGLPAEGDATSARRLVGLVTTSLEVFTLASFAAPLAPSTAARAVGREISFIALLAALRALPPCDWRILEGAGGIATPLDAESRDWADFAATLAPDAVVIVVPDRLGAINQARLAHARAATLCLNAGVWLNEFFSADPTVAASNRSELSAAGVPLWSVLADLKMELSGPDVTSIPEPNAPGQARSTSSLLPRLQHALAERVRDGLIRELRISASAAITLNLADNDYLALAHDPALADAVASAAHTYGTSAAASPLITGWQSPHAALTAELCAWHGFAHGLLWSSGYAANSAVLGLLPRRGDLVLADRLIHHSMIAGLLRSGARLQRYEHLDLTHLEKLLEKKYPPSRPSAESEVERDYPARSTPTVFVITESVFSMDGDYPDLARLAELKRRHNFVLIVDEAHALGWHGPEGSGLVCAAGIADAVDVFIGTLGKTLASGGAYTLFRDASVRDYLVNFAGEFIYSTALSPLNVAAASAALARVRALASAQPRWHALSRDLRTRLRAAGWDAPDGDSPIVPVKLGGADDAMSLAAALREKNILVGAVRPPTVPAGTSRLRLSLKRTFSDAHAQRLLTAMDAWRSSP